MIIAGDTIAAIATPPGNGGVGVIRISGPGVINIAASLSAKKLKPRYATYSSFLDADGGNIDSGLLLYFQAPASFTGEDVLELHGIHCHDGNQDVLGFLLLCIL